MIGFRHWMQLYCEHYSNAPRVIFGLCSDEGGRCKSEWYWTTVGKYIHRGRGKRKGVTEALSAFRPGTKVRACRKGQELRGEPRAPEDTAMLTAQSTDGCDDSPRAP